jgi:hypothetical protein
MSMNKDGSGMACSALLASMVGSQGITKEIRSVSADGTWRKQDTSTVRLANQF